MTDAEAATYLMAGQEWMRRALTAQDRVAELETALQRILLELGVPDVSYPAPVEAAVELTRDALEGGFPDQ